MAEQGSDTSESGEIGFFFLLKITGLGFLWIWAMFLPKYGKTRHTRQSYTRPTLSAHDGLLGEHMQTRHCSFIWILIDAKKGKMDIFDLSHFYGSFHASGQHRAVHMKITL